MTGEQLTLDFSPLDYSWSVQCTSARVERRRGPGFGEPFRWYHVADGEAHAHRLAARVMREHRGVVAVVRRRRGAA